MTLEGHFSQNASENLILLFLKGKFKGSLLTKITEFIITGKSLIYETPENKNKIIKSHKF